MAYFDAEDSASRKSRLADGVRSAIGWKLWLLLFLLTGCLAFSITSFAYAKKASDDAHGSHAAAAEAQSLLAIVSLRGSTSPNLPIQFEGDEVCQALSGAENATLRATFCTDSATVGSFRCTGSAPCYVPLSEVRTAGMALTRTSDTRGLSVSQMEMYYFSFTAQLEGACPRTRRAVTLSLIDRSSNSVIKTVPLNAHYAAQTCVRALLTPGTLVSFRLENATGINADTRITLVGDVSTTPDYSWLQWAADYSRTKLRVQWIPFIPPTITNTSSGFAPQYPAASAVFPWFANYIPSECGTGTPAPGLPNNNAYDKQRSVQESVGFYVYTNFTAQAPTDTRNTLFLTNLRDRGIGIDGRDNWRKRQYMGATHTAVIRFYQEKTQTMMERIYTDTVLYRKPLLSTFKRHLVTFFLDVHCGINEHPKYVVDYFSSFETFVSSANLELPELYSSHVDYWRVDAYLKERAKIVEEKEDVTTLTYWWIKDGFNRDTLSFEMSHNIVAYSQFGHIGFLTSRDVTTGTPTPLGPVKYDFFTRYAAAATPEDKLDVARELVRLLVPNAVSFSFMRECPANPNQPPVQSRHVHQLLMLTAVGRRANPSNPFNTTFWAGYYQYDTSKYAPFRTSLGNVNCPPGTPPLEGSDPARPGAARLPELFTSNSPVDGRTVVDICNPLIQPVYPDPLFAPLGLAERRCAGETVVYQVTEAWLDRFSSTEIYIGPADPAEGATIGVAPFTEVPNVFYVRGKTTPTPRAAASR